jgi:hypothetical protein
MSSSKKVVHISDYVHAAVKKHCTKIEVPLKDWAERALLSAVEREDHSAKARFSYVSKKPLVELPNDGDKDDGIRPWELPPFWERTGTFAPEENQSEEEVQLRVSPSEG